MCTGWSAISLSLDVPDSVAIPVKIKNVELALWRSASGKLHLWQDRCPHRGMRLSHGFVRGEKLSCIYHGWQYGDNGVCSHIPAHPEIVPPPSICAETHSVAETDGVIWGALGVLETTPPAILDRTPLRSMEIRVPMCIIEEHLGKKGQISVFKGMTLLLHPVNDTRTMLHTLAEEGVDKRKSSQRLEALRKELEGDSFC